MPWDYAEFLGCPEECLHILLKQATTHQPDAMIWYQVAFAYQDLDMSDAAIAAYERALELDPDFDLAVINLGGVYWNRGDAERAHAVWTIAIARFPDNELANRPRTEFSFLFENGRQ